MITRIQRAVKAEASQLSSFAPARSGLLQRKCACGGNAGLDGGCTECHKQRILQRRASAASSPVVAPPIVDDVLRAPGDSLDSTTRVFMEKRLGHDFSRVRVHTDAKAAESARAVTADAYTVGTHVAFGAGHYRPSSPAGRSLIAHELTHVVQQSAENSVSGLPTQMDQPSSPAESEANAVAESVEVGGSRVNQRVTPHIQRDVSEPSRLATVHQNLFVSAPGAPGSPLRPWQDATGGGGGTADEIIRQAKAAVQQRVRDHPQSVGGTIPTQTTEANLDADALLVNQRIHQRFPQITLSVSDQQITNAVGVLTPSITADPDYLHQWLANRLSGWTEIELYAINETDPRFVAVLDALLNDADVGSFLRIMAGRQAGFNRGDGTSREVFIHRGVSAEQRQVVLIHELVHFYAHAKYREWVETTTNSRFYNEGFTEWLSQKVMTADERARGNTYDAQVAAINTQVAAHVPEDDIARAFFLGEVWWLESRSTIARREFAVSSGIRERATTNQESVDSRSGPGINEEVVPGAHYRFLNLGNERPQPKPQHVSFFNTIKSRYVDPPQNLGIRFEGHASTPGSLQYNDRLSLQRAEGFYQMARAAGVPALQLLGSRQPVHFGETRPTLAEEDIQTRAFNRRVEMFLTVIGGSSGPT